MKYYVLCGHPNNDSWFAFTDGHFYNKANFIDASSASNLVEASRMLAYAQKESPDANIVIVDILPHPVPQKEIDTANYESAIDKLTVEELRLITDRE